MTPPLRLHPPAFPLAPARLAPANHPQRRFALASRWSLDGDLASKLERWCAREVPDSALAASLLKALQVEPDDFRSWHCTFRSPRLKQAQPLLGFPRVPRIPRFGN